MDELKKCPFCGEEAKLLDDFEIIGDKISKKFYIKCTGCGASTSKFSTNYEALAGWNKRTDNP